MTDSKHLKNSMKFIINTNELSGEIFAKQLAYSRRTDGGGQRKERQAKKKKERGRGRAEERTPVNILNKSLFRYTRSWYTLWSWLVNFDIFCQHSGVLKLDAKRDMTAVGDLSTVQYESVINKVICTLAVLHHFWPSDPSLVLFYLLGYGLDVGLKFIISK